MKNANKSLRHLPLLQNRYLIMRHGRSLANDAGVIVSHAQNGLNDYGLSQTGREQVALGIANSTLTADTRIISSDFKRARETAEIVHRKLTCQHSLSFDIRLRERHFGDLELGPDSRYDEVWTADLRDPEHNIFGVESLDSVIERAHALILDCEQGFSKQTCLLVAHGDILQILQTAFEQISPRRHRELTHLATAEVRALQQKAC